MASHDNIAFTVPPGMARVVTLTGAIVDDEIAVLYCPKTSGDMPDNLFVHLTKKGEPVVLTEKNPVALLSLPGTYKVQAIGPLSANAHVEASDRGFPYTLMGGIND